MTDFLLELRSEEIPARMQARARDDLARLFAAELAKAGLHATETVTYATPRRLALIARGLPDATEAVSEEAKGPKAAAPPQALEGFLRKTGLTRDQLTERDGVFFAVTQKPGRATAQVLAEAIPAVIRAFPWPKSMRWGAASLTTDSLRWVRPLHGIVALFGEEIVPVEIAGVVSGAATLGHRFHHPGQITIGSAADYFEKLHACHVIVDQDARAAIIRHRAAALAADAGLELVEDEGLVAENAGLTEWPVPLLGRFDEAFLAVPPEVIQLTARVNQKYFVCRGASGKLANAFICTANIAAADDGAKIVEGNRKVLAARLADARFFYEQDARIRLEDHAAKLDRIVFHEKLGTVADKVARVAKLARWLVEEGIIPSPLRGEGGRAEGEAGRGAVASVSPGTAPLPSAASGGSLPLPGGEREHLATLADRAARLCKADLVTGMVGEFPELQGLMGGYYASAQGEDPQVAAAIRDHYKPVGQGDEVPTAPVTVAVSLADKLDTLLGFFAIGQAPSGSRDPFALRRAALGFLATIIGNNLRLSLQQVTDWVGMYFPEPVEETDSDQLLDALRERDPNYRAEWDGDQLVYYHGEQELIRYQNNLSQGVNDYDLVWEGFDGLLRFFVERLKVQQREKGVRHDLIDAVFALMSGSLWEGEDDLVRLLARVRALQAFMASEDGANLLAGYKRAANILKKEGYDFPSPLAGEGGRPAGPEGRGGRSQSERALAPQAHPSSDPADAGPPSPAGGEGKIDLSYTPEPAETALIAALDAAEPRAAHAVAAEDFEGAMAALASLRAPIDAFFETVTVNDPDAAKRAARLALLARVRDAVHTVADFSKIEG